MKIIKKIGRELKLYFISLKIAQSNRLYIQKLLDNTNKIKIELGESKKRKNMDDWTTIDCMRGGDICLELSKPFPLPDNSVDIIYSSHLLEHFSYPNPMLQLLKECCRMLKPDGIFSVCVPNARIYVNIYLNPKDYNVDDFFRYKPMLNYNSNIDYLNCMAYMEGHHKYMFDEENLLIILKKVGFRNVKLREFNNLLDREERKYESIYAECIK